MRPLYAAALDALEPLQGRDAPGRRLRQRPGPRGRSRARGGRQRSRRHARTARDRGERTPSADLRVGDIQELPYGDGTFDVVTAFNSVQYAVDPAAAVAELARVCRSGGRVAIGIWGDPARCETEGLFARLRSLAPPPPGTPAPLALSDAGVVEDLLVKAGLNVDGGAEVPFPISSPPSTTPGRPTPRPGPCRRSSRSPGAADVRRVVDAVLTADRKPDGSLRQDNVLRYVIAVKP